MGISLKNLAAVTKASIERNTQIIESRIVIISIVAAMAFPLYYFVWHYLFPQPYENLALRLLGSALFTPLVFVRRWPKTAKRYLPIYWYLVTLFGLPFFFTYMLLMNAVSTVWLMSALIAVFLMIPIHSLLNLIIQFVTGTGMACLAYSLSVNQVQPPIDYLKYLPIYLFAIVAGGLLNFSTEMVNRERLRAMLATASNIAHELRTPLLGIKSGATGLQRYLPALLDTYRMAQEHGLKVEPIRLAHIQAMHGVLERIEGEADHSNTIIDMLLMNTRSGGISPENFSACSVAKCVETAIERYPFSSEGEKHLVSWDKGDDFRFQGIELLTVHVLFNLMKNALYHIAKAGKGDISIRLEKTPRGNVLIFTDTGSGIPPNVLPHIFTRFYSWSPDNDGGLGSGIGLAFCRSVMESFGGAIRCDSQEGAYTEFVLTFPRIAEVAP